MGERTNATISLEKAIAWAGAIVVATAIGTWAVATVAMGGAEDSETIKDLRIQLADARTRLVSSREQVSELSRQIDALDDESCNRRIYVGGVWLNSQGKAKFIDQSGPAGGNLVVTEGSTVYPAVFESESRIRANAPGEVLFGDLSSDGKTLTWTHAPSRPWTRSRSPQLACDTI